MKKLTIVILIIGYLVANAAGQKKCFILVRHAEKDISATADKVDPELTDVGKARAERLVKVIKKYKPGAVYSTNFKRTVSTAKQVGTWRKKEIQIYDPKLLKELVETMIASKTKRFLVVGHNNTTPALANLLIKEEKYEKLPETEYGKMWIVKIKKGKLKSVEVVDY